MFLILLLILVSICDAAYKPVTRPAMYIPINAIISILFLLNYTLQIADNALILGHRLSEWCGHGPILEQDIAMTNIALDLIGQARSLYQYAAEVEGKGRTEDDLA